jgi:hypothetical protein
MEPAGEIVGFDQVYVVPIGTMSPLKLSGVMLKEFPLQMMDVLLEMTGFGLMVTAAILEVKLEQPPVDKMMMQ